MNMKLLIVAGGGGHFAPALAVIEKLPKDTDVMVVGRKYAFEQDKTLSFEYLTSQKLGLNFQTITTGRLQRKITTHTLTSLIKVPVGYFQALKLLKEFKPDAVLSFGGYVSLPVAFAAKTLKIPLVIHEQILGAGLANKVAAKFAARICVSWEQSKKFFPAEKVVLTGNPMRKAVSYNSQLVTPKENLPIIYVTGGSGGAHSINILIEDCLEKLLEKYIVIHQTGDAREFGDFDRLEKKRKSLPLALQARYTPVKFVDSKEVFAVLDKADLVVARSGINTVTELLAAGKPCILIPLPYGQYNEQLTNALFVRQLGLGIAAEQKDLTGDKLYALINSTIKDLDEFKKHSKEARELIIPDAAEKIIKIIEHVSNEKKNITQS